MTLIELSLILMYTAVLIIKTCEVDLDACVQYGFGSTGRGVYIFFVFFGLCVVLTLTFTGLASLYFSGDQIAAPEVRTLT